MSDSSPAATAAPARFENLGLSAAMLESLRQCEYLEPTPIQAGLIPRALAGVDVLGQARTGTGKTAAFAIPILEKLRPEHRGPQALVLAPTRELAVQVREEVVKLAFGRKVHVVALYGGKPIRGQLDKLRRGAEVVVGTPGRVLDHLARGSLVLDQLHFVVLDEADRMLDIGFRPDIEKILKRCPTQRQTLLLSATVPGPVERLARRYMRDPESLNFSPQEISVDTIQQYYFTVDPERKFDLLVRLLKREEPRQAIVFCRTKRGTDKVQRRLRDKFDGVDCIHGDLAQNARDRVMGKFREGNVRYLIATDVVGRGIDVSGISHIVNFDVPEFCDDYVHRVGRTGRMGREGVAFTFVSPEEGGQLTSIEVRINKLLQRAEMEGFETFARRAPSLPKPGAAPGDDPGPTPPEEAEPEAEKKPPGMRRGGRVPRRFRRAL